MTTSYKKEAIAELRKRKQVMRELEAIEFAAEEKRKADRDAANQARIAAKLGRATGEEPAPPPVVLSDLKEALPEEPAIKPKRRRKAAPKKEAQDAAQERTWSGDGLTIRERRALINETLMNGLLKDMEQYKYLQGELRALDFIEETIRDYLKKEAR